ncbi:MAG TPA: EamA family transporter [Phenylobacterium sp.]
MRARELLLCLAFAAMLPVGQVLFKLASLQDGKLDGGLPVRLVQNLPLVAAFAWYGLSAVLWVAILRRTPLSAAYPFSLLGSAFVPPIAWLVFGEPLTWTMVGGYLLMLGGLVLLTPKPTV